MKKNYDLLYNIIKNNNKYDLYFFDDSLNTYFFIKAFDKNVKIYDIKKYIASVWDLKKYIVKLQYNF